MLSPWPRGTTGTTTLSVVVTHTWQSSGSPGRLRGEAGGGRQAPSAGSAHLARSLREVATVWWAVMPLARSGMQQHRVRAEGAQEWDLGGSRATGERGAGGGSLTVPGIGAGPRIETAGPETGRMEASALDSARPHVSGLGLRSCRPGVRCPTLCNRICLILAKLHCLSIAWFLHCRKWIVTVQRVDGKMT